MGEPDRRPRRRTSLLRRPWTFGRRSCREATSRTRRRGRGSGLREAHAKSSYATATISPEAGTRRRRAAPSRCDTRIETCRGAATARSCGSTSRASAWPSASSPRCGWRSCWRRSGSASRRWSTPPSDRSSSRCTRSGGRTRPWCVRQHAFTGVDFIPLFHTRARGRSGSGATTSARTLRRALDIQK